MRKVIIVFIILFTGFIEGLNAQNSITVDQVIYGLMGPTYRDGSEGLGAPWGLHELAPHGVPSSYDWCDGARPGTWLSNSAYEGINIWGQCYIPVTGTPVKNYRVQIRNMISYKYENNTWTMIEKTPNNFGGWWYHEDFNTNNITKGNQRKESAANGGGISATMTVGHTFHFWTDTWPRAQMPHSAEAIYSTFEARLLTDSDPNVNLDNVQLYAGLGMDAYTTRNYSAGSNERITSLAIGRMQRITSSWKVLGMYLCGSKSTTFTAYESNVKSRPLPPGVTNEPFMSVISVSAYQNSVKLYPNPVVGGQLNVDASALIGSLSLSVYSTTGEKITFQTAQGGSLIHLDISNLKAGIYFLNVINNKGMNVNQRFVVK